ncbi:hypothetical protein BC739_008580 [Kutzneria viridogrisea]|uniref:Uncharacterized protein n=1 Tax=Kutzneria viridogrisea TaxID=47990 RepID=A0ABR6BWP8_9PSEU|nr:hypothetical protein [Kutzneria albida]MBA8931333.1 hypothetical protein [Kutzneria viridogrisea]
MRDKLRQDLQKKPLADTLKEIVGDETIASTTLLNSGSDSSSRFFADFAIVGSGEAGGGGDYKQVAVRLCVHYSGMVGISGQIDMADLKCPEGLPATVRGVDVKKNISLAS